LPFRRPRRARAHRAAFYGLKKIVSSATISFAAAPPVGPALVFTKNERAHRGPYHGTVAFSIHSAEFHHFAPSNKCKG
jgi:hypothetical protein